MSSKQIVTGLLERMPEEASLHDIVQEIEFIAAVREGLKSYDREGGVTLEEAKTKVSSWAQTASR